PEVVPSLITTDSVVPTATPTPTISPTPSPAPVTISPTSRCDRAAADNPIDITIPDDTVMEAGQAFTKQWGLINAGSCDWTPQYAAAWFSGEMMGAPSSVPIGVLVQPGNSVVLSVDMVAPLKPGTYRSNWKMKNEADTLFGIGPNGDSPFWVQIVVEAIPTDTPEPTLLPTGTPETPTATATPVILVSGPAQLAPNDLIDLDALVVNPGGGADLLYEAAEDQTHWLIPQSGALLGVWGVSQPGPSDCQSASLGASPLPVESLTAGAYLCFLTDQGHYGRTQVIGQDPATFVLSTQILTWAP
ncbi:MAG: NBR1-Ig-like domain-containing protein, partial [Anaerolineales bacterium]|nr:NBR1-Ig-like domain-containing protein [Anaerolineales bacterium]